ncbi:pyridoxal phosphate-dependent transferase [Zopfochytrium polystomum]|nr:pyridoxal phosphate-dependent transferase [Zopfochytrium polystomum]
MASPAADDTNNEAGHHQLALEFSTLAVHADNIALAPRGRLPADLAAPIGLSSTYRYPSDWNERAAERLALKQDVHATDPSEIPLIYSRYTTETRDRVEIVLGALENGFALTYASGLAAVAAAFQFYQPKRVFLPGEGYFGTHSVLNEFKRGRDTTAIFLETLDLDSVKFVAGDLVWLESPQNPRGEIYDVERFKALCSEGAHVVVDATFTPPPLQFCLNYGADMVMHSSTKFLGGHSDLLGGVLVVKDKATRNQLLQQRNAIGNVMGNMEAWLLLRSLRTLEIRVTKQSESATFLAAWLASKTPTPHPTKPNVEIQPPPPGVVHRVWHATLSLPSPGDVGPAKASSTDPPALLRRWGARGSGVLSISFETPKLAQLACNNLRLFANATSLGGVESLIEWRAAVDSKIDPRVCRVSVGIEDKLDLVEDFRQCFVQILKLAQQK